MQQSRSWSSRSRSGRKLQLVLALAALALFFTMCLDHWISLNSALPTDQPGRRWSSGRQGSGRQGSGRQGSGRQGSGRQGSGREGSGRQGSGREGSGRQGSGREDRDNVELTERVKHNVNGSKSFVNVNEKRKPFVIVDKSGGVNVTRTDKEDGADHGEPPVRVPPLVHVIWFYPPNTTFRFHQLLSVLSVQQHVAPTSLMFWHAPQAPPVGAWWRFAKETLAGSLYLVERAPPHHVFGRAVKRPEHQADVARLDILLQHGGIYIDLDVIVVKSVRPLLRYPVSMGAESPHLLGSGVIVAEKNASFLALWRQHYASFDDAQWNEHSVVLPMLLASQHPHLIHIEWFSLHRPNWDERQWLYEDGKLWAWQQDNLAVHLWYREYHTEHDPHSIRAWNTTAGEIFRYIYYGSPDLLDP